MRLIDRIRRAAVRIGFARRSTALLETTGRKTGLPRVTPVTNGLDGNVFWVVTEHGHQADYVRNIQAEPRVRVWVGKDWRAGSAQIVTDDPETRLRRIAAVNQRARTNAQIVRKTGTEHLVIRVDLDDKADPNAMTGPGLDRRRIRSLDQRASLPGVRRAQAARSARLLAEAHVLVTAAEADLRP